MSGERTHQARTDRIAAAIARRGPPPSDPFPCPYLKDRTARHVALIPEPLLPGIYHSLMDLNFRRLGNFFYRPSCLDCSECRMIRIPVDRFHPSRAQRRCLARNADLALTWSRPTFTRAKHALYQRYLRSRHDGAMDGSVLELRRFLYTSPLQTLELSVHSDARILAVSTVDLEPDAMSAVYTFFDPGFPKVSIFTRMGPPLFTIFPPGVPRVTLL